MTRARCLDLACYVAQGQSHRMLGYLVVRAEARAEQGLALLARSDLQKSPAFFFMFAFFFSLPCFSSSADGAAFLNNLRRGFLVN